MAGDITMVSWGQAMAEKRWVYIGAKGGKKPTPSEKDTITAACDDLIDNFFIPKFLPEIRPDTRYNYLVAIFGKWHGNTYRFITKYKSDGPNSIKPEFDAPFTRLEYTGKDSFDLSYMRHTGQWVRLFERLSLAEAVKTIKEMIHFHPTC